MQERVWEITQTEADVDSTTGVWNPSFLRPLEVALPPDLQKRTDVLTLYDRAMFGLGNTDARSVVLIHGLSTIPVNCEEVHRDVRQTLPSDTWVPKPTVIHYRYFDAGLCKVGFVERFCDSGRYLYNTTREGEGLAKGVAALVIKSAAGFEKPVSSILGITTAPQDSRVRSYLSRTALLLLLYRGPSYVSKILKETGMSPVNVGTNLRKLRDLGLINYDYTDTEVGGWAMYERVGDPSLVKQSSVGNRLRSNVLEYFRLNDSGNPQTIARAIERNDHIDVHKILSEMVEAGFLQRTRWYGGVQQSEAQIEDEGKKFVESFILPTLYAFAGDATSISALNSVRQEVEEDPAISAKAISIQRYFGRRIPRPQTGKAIIDFIKQNGPSRPTQLQKQFGIRVEPVLSQLVRSGTLVRKRAGRGSFYMFSEDEAPRAEKRFIVHQYVLPETLLIQKALSKEDYRASLETLEFWVELTQNLKKIPAGTVTESYFFQFYSPDNPDWQNPNDYRSGKYARLVYVLRQLGIRNPYKFLKDFKPESQQEEIKNAVRSAKNFLKRRLLESLVPRRWEDYQKDLHSDVFWRRLYRDIKDAPTGITMGQFLSHYSDDHPQHFDPTVLGKYSNLYSQLRNHTENGTNHLRDFQPDLSVTPQLQRHISRSQRLMTKKFVFHIERRQPEYWIEAIATAQFWEEARRDLRNYNGNTTFGNFLYSYTEDNRDVSKKYGNGYSVLGKYYRILSTISNHRGLFLKLPEMGGLSENLTPSEIAKWLVYRASPIEIQDLLLAKFPKEFRPIDDKHVAQEENWPTRIANAFETRNWPSSIQTIVSKIDSLARTSIQDKLAMLVFALWERDPSMNNVVRISTLLNLDPTSVYNLVDNVVKDERLETIWDRYLDLEENLES